MDNYIYLHLKDHIKREAGQDIYLDDITELSCSPDVRDKLTKLVILQEKGVGIITLSVVEVIELIRQFIPEIPIISTGNPRLLYIFMKRTNIAVRDLLALLGIHNQLVTLYWFRHRYHVLS